MNEAYISNLLNIIFNNGESIVTGFGRVRDAYKIIASDSIILVTCVLC